MSTTAVMATTANLEGSLPLLGKVYALTGGCSGIALGTARLLSKRGATVCMADIDADAIKSVELSFSVLNVPYMIRTVDVSKRSEVEGWIKSIVEKYGRLDGACNAAGIIGSGHGTVPVSKLQDSEWDKIIAVNLTGTMYCLRAQLGSIVDGGSIVNVASIHGIKGRKKIWA